MGRFRRFLPYTAIGMVVAWLAIAGIPPLSGFFSKDEIITEVFLAHDYGLWIVALVAAVVHRHLHDPADLPHLLRQRALAHRLAPVVSGGADDVAPAQVDARRSTTTTWPTATRRPRSPTATRCDCPTAPHAAARVARRTWSLPILLLAGLAAVDRLPQHAVRRRSSSSTTGSSRRSRTSRCTSRRRSSRARRSRCSRSCSRSSGIARRRTGSTAAGSTTPETRPARRAARRGRAGARERLLLRHTASRELVDGPCARFARLPRRGRRPEDHRRRGRRRRAPRASAPRAGLRHVQDGFVRRYALGIAFGAAGAAPLRRRLGRAVAVDDFPILSAIIAVPIAGVDRVPARAVEPSRDRQGGRLRDHDDHVRARRMAALALRRRRSARSSSSRTSRWIPRLGVSYLVGVDGISIFMIAVTALLFPLGLARIRAVHHRTGSRRTWRGSCSSRGRSWGSSSPST